MERDMQNIILFIAIAFGIATLIAGASNKVVIYYNNADFRDSFFALALLIGSFFLLQSEPFNTSYFNFIANWIVAPIAGFFGIKYTIKSFKDSIRHNRSNAIGIFIGVYKLIYIVLGVFVVFGQVNKIFDKKSSFKDVAIAGLLLSIFGVLLKAMINGERVYVSRGWALT